jgi:hypothetical protein
MDEICDGTLAHSKLLYHTALAMPVYQKHENSKGQNGALERFMRRNPYFATHINVARDFLWH